VQRGGPSTGMPTRTQQSDLMICAYASHGDTKHVLLLPKDPRELFEFSALSFDLAERLQTPIFVLEDLDIGMNDWLCEPFTWDDSRTHDRGKVMTAEELEAGKTFGRYLDVDGDAIPYRTLPGTHATKGAFFTRGTSRDRFAKYSEEGAVYQDNMQRLLRKFETAKSLVPAPVITMAKGKEKSQDRTKYGLVFFGSSAPAAREALAALAESGIHLDRMRIRAFPFSDTVSDFINAYDQIFLVEQNRDAQMRSLLVNECGIDPARFISILNYDGTPITARFIINSIAERVAISKRAAAE
jgi:2-oxoglutarate/2-oxoacid ferredoxin oxidoreductase subunit alpha